MTAARPIRRRPPRCWCRQPLRLATVVLALCTATPIINAASADEEVLRLFENSVRPLFIDHCVECHGEDPSGGLRIDSRDSLLRGGDSGPAVVPGDPGGSLLLRAVRHEGDLEMPPEEPLSPQQIDALAAWIELGAPWPASSLPSTADAADVAARHWAFQPVGDPAIPQPENGGWIRTPVDAFVLARLESAGLSPSPEADRHTLIRRATYTLTGLPPSPEAVRAFVDDPDPLAYERLIDRLLDSPRYGEHWARHWLDVARYSDTKGYVYAREERFWVHARNYRDWVVSALNDDMPYDRFLLLQLAADQVEPKSPGDLAAMGFLTLGRRFLGVERDIIDDRIDVVTRGTMALTVGCARCHNHKYDPIPTADYYSLYGVFDSCAERLIYAGQEPIGDTAFQTELEARQEKLRTALATSREESATRARSRVADYLQAQTELEKYPPKGFDQIFQKSDLLPAFAHRWEAYLRNARRRHDPVFVPWHAYFELAEETFAESAIEVTERLQNAADGEINPRVRQAFATPPTSRREVIERYGALFADVDARWRALQEEAEQNQKEPPRQLPDAADEALRLVLYAPNSPCQVPDQGIVHTEEFFDSDTCTKLWQLQAEVERWIINSDVDAPFALALVDRSEPVEPRIFRRGNPADKGPEVPRQFLELLSGEERRPFQQGSGRFELAQAIIDPGNPLTARVMVNRLWMHHFQEGLVTTPSDFGTRAAEPSHPELLDFLASRFVDDGWSLKKLHRMLLLSSTFRQSSAGPHDPAQGARARHIDPANRLLWRMNPHRLTFEEFRDSLLAASECLDLSQGGRPAPLFERPYPTRRTLYGLVDRQFLPSTLRVFDFANPDLHIPQRSETTVPQQALFFLNHPLVIDQARQLASQVNQMDAAAGIGDLFARVLQRTPSDSEIAQARALLHAASSQSAPTPPATADQWQYGYGAFDEAAARVTGFAELPYFSGTAWQGGPAFPDAELGWVQLSAHGGHPGNDRQHASVRRWTAPRPMHIEIRSQLIHEAPAGDGIRAFIVSSRSGLRGSATIHQKTIQLDVEPFTVEAGETIDFVVDIGDVLNSDQYLWTASLEEMVGSEPGVKWNSQSDFTQQTAQRLTPWEQLAHVLFCTNEFLFVD